MSPPRGLGELLMDGASSSKSSSSSVAPALRRRSAILMKSFNRATCSAVRCQLE